MAKSDLKLFWVKIPECDIDGCIYEPTKKKAAKGIFKKYLDQRGRTYFSFANREFINPTEFANYLEKHGLLDKYVTLGSNLK